MAFGFSIISQGNFDDRIHISYSNDDKIVTQRKVFKHTDAQDDDANLFEFVMSSLQVEKKHAWCVV